MAEPFLLTQEPVDIIDAMSLNAGSTYSIQADPRHGGLVHVDDSDAEPTAAAGRKLRSLETARVKAGSGGKLWAWSPSSDANNPVHINVFEEP